MYLERWFLLCGKINAQCSGRSRAVAPGTPSPLWIQILSFSCSFRGKFGQIMGFCLHLGSWRPLLGNPGSATAMLHLTLTEDSPQNVECTTCRMEYQSLAGNVDFMFLIFFCEKPCAIKEMMLQGHTPGWPPWIRHCGREYVHE